MKIFIETNLKDFYMSLVDKDNVIDRIYYKDLIKKSDIVSFSLKDLLKRNNIDLNKIEGFYSTKGPGSFMGIRASLMLVSTLAGTLDKDLYLISTLKFLSLLYKGDIYINAKGGKAYTIKEGKEKIIISSKETLFDYKDFEENVKNILPHFEKANPFEDNSSYLKEPKIG